MKKKNNIEEVHTIEEIEFYSQRRAIIFLEAAIGELLEHFDLDEAKKIFKSYEDMLEDISVS